MAENAAPRNWEWTPPAALNWDMKTILRLPLVHRLVSKSLLLITFTGRKSGKQYSTPIGYHRDGDILTSMSKRFRMWWKNFETPAPVMVRVQGQNIASTAISLTDPVVLEPIIAHIVEAAPREAQIYGITLTDGKADAAEVAALAPKVVVIQVVLDSTRET